MSTTSHILPPRAIGIDLIDEQHRNLHRMVVEFEQAFEAQDTPALLVDRLSQIYQYSVIHFEAEEDLIGQYLPHALEAHRVEHAHVLEGLRACVVEYKRSGSGIPFKVCEALRTYVTCHMSDDDAELLEPIREMIAADVDDRSKLDPH